MNVSEEVSKLYSRMPWHVRWHVRSRMRLCPYDEVAALLPTQGAILDIGCGYGHFCWRLMLARSGVQTYGCDVDARKIAVARACVSAPHGPVFHLGDPETMPGLPARLDGIAIVDSLYLIPAERQKTLLAWTADRLRPAGRLALKVLDTEAGWRTRRALIQEWMMVKLVRGTARTGERFETPAPNAYRDWLNALGLATEVRRLNTMNPSALVWGTRK